MNGHRGYSIYKRIILVTLISFMIQVILMVSVTSAQYRSSLEQIETTFNTLMSKNLQRINEQLETVTSIASSVACTSDVQKYFLESNANSRVNSYQSLKFFFGILIEANPAVEAICVRNDKEAFLYSGNYKYLFEYLRKDYDLKSDLLQENRFFSDIYYLRSDPERSRPFCMYVFSTGAIPSIVSSDNRLYCAVLFDLGKLLEINNENPDQLEILNYNGEMLTNNKQLRTLGAQFNVQSDENFNVIRIGDENCYVRTSDLNTTAPLSYTFVVPMNTLFGDIHAYMQFSILMITISLIIAVLLLISMRNGIIRPINQMTANMQAITNDAGIIYPTEAVELNIIADGINRMLHTLRRIQKREIEQQVENYRINLEKTKAQLLGYRSQINPHFLFNTLGCMCGMARYHGIDELEDLIMAMSDSYRYVLRTADYVSLEQEITHVKNYMQIMNIRYPNKYHLQIDVKESDLAHKVPALLLQPLVENAVLHGFANYEKPEPCTIVVNTSKHNGFLHITVRDNGTGLSAEQIQQLQAHMSSEKMDSERKHIALQNISRRLFLSYGEGGHIAIHSEQGSFTCFVIQLPLSS